MTEILANIKSAVESPLVAHLSPSDSASRLLQSALTANSQYETSLRNSSEEQGILGLENEIRRLQRGVQGLNMDVLHQRDKIQDSLLQRWT
jgi:hypothetical protein